MEISVILIAVLLSIVMLHFLKQLWSHKNYPPGPLRLPIIGGIWKILLNFSQDTLIKLAKEYGNVYTIWAGSLPVVVVSGFEAVKEAAINHSEYFDERPASPFFEAMTKQKGIAFSNGHTWKQQRRFGLVTMRKLGLGKKGIEYIVHEEAHQLARTFADLKGQPLDPTLPITNCVTNVVCALTFGHQFSIRDENFLKLRDTISVFVHSTATVFHVLYDLFPWIMKHFPGPHKEGLATRDFVASFMMEEVQKHKAHQTMHAPQDFIDYYLLQMEKSKRDPHSTFDDENLNQCMIDLFVAGTETVSSTLLWGLLLMTNYPDIQEKVQKEIDNVFGPSQVFFYQDRKKVPYTNAVIHEIQRYQYVALFGVPRQCSKDVNLFGFFIPKGATVITDFRSVLLDPKQWETPQKFNPNHFLDKDGNFVESEAFLPFGAGIWGHLQRLRGFPVKYVFKNYYFLPKVPAMMPEWERKAVLQAGARVCLGEHLARIELFIFFTKLLRTFTFQPPEGVKKISEEPIIRLVTPPHPYKIWVIPRRNGVVKP